MVIFKKPLKCLILILVLALSSKAAVIQSIKSMVVPSANLETYGIWSEKQSGLGHKIWKKSTRAKVEELLSMSWPDVTSTTLHKLALRILLTATEVPTPQYSSKNLLELRARRLYQLGEITHAFELIKGYSAQVNPSLFHKLKFSVLLSQQHYAEALKLALAQAPETKDVFWQEAIIFCQLLDPAQQEAARFALSIYKDNPKIADREFVLLAEQLLGKKDIEIPVLSTHSFIKTLMRLKVGNLSDSLIRLLPPGHLILLSKYPEFKNLPIATRIRIQERIATYDPTTNIASILRDIYVETSLQEKCPFNTKADPIGQDLLLTKDDPVVRAHLFYQMSTSTEASKRTNYAVLLLRNALNHDLFVPMAHLAAPFLKDTGPLPDPSVKPYIMLADTFTNFNARVTPETISIEDPVLLTAMVLHYPGDGWDKALEANLKKLDASPYKHVLLGILYPWHKELASKFALSIWKDQADFEPELSKAPFLLSLLLGDALSRKQLGETMVLTIMLSAYEEKGRTISSLPLMLRALYRTGLQKEAADLAMEDLLTMIKLPPLALSNPAPVKMTSVKLKPSPSQKPVALKLHVNPTAH